MISIFHSFTFNLSVLLYYLKWISRRPHIFDSFFFNVLHQSQSFNWYILSIYRIYLILFQIKLLWKLIWLAETKWPRPLPARESKKLLLTFQTLFSRQIHEKWKEKLSGVPTHFSEMSHLPLRDPWITPIPGTATFIFMCWSQPVSWESEGCGKFKTSLFI